MGGCEDRTWTREAEESPLLESVARERMMKTEGWKRLSGCCGNLWIVKINGGAVITCFPSRVYKWSMNLFTNPNPVYSHSYTWLLYMLIFMFVDMTRENKGLWSERQQAFTEFNIRVILSRVEVCCVTCKTGSGLKNWIYWHLIHTTRVYRQYSANADLRTFYNSPLHTH
jgi:hypothetical protein